MTKRILAIGAALLLCLFCVCAWAEGENCRLDYMFSRNPVRIRSSRVICNGTLYPVVSDHFGVMVTV